MRPRWCWGRPWKGGGRSSRGCGRRAHTCPEGRTSNLERFFLSSGFSFPWEVRADVRGLATPHLPIWTPQGWPLCFLLPLPLASTQLVLLPAPRCSLLRLPRRMAAPGVERGPALPWSPPMESSWPPAPLTLTPFLFSLLPGPLVPSLALGSESVLPCFLCSAGP